MRILVFILKAVFGSIISKIISICVLAVGSLYIVHVTGRLAPIMQIAGIESDGSFTGAVTSIGTTVAERTGLRAKIEQQVGSVFGGAGTAPVEAAASDVGRAYIDVAARISEVSRECRLLDLRGDRVTRTQPMPCHEAEEMVTRTEFKGFEVRRYARVAYIYYAPDGKTVMNGTFSPSSTDRREFRVGSVIDIQVNPANPSQSRPI